MSQPTNFETSAVPVIRRRGSSQRVPGVVTGVYPGPCVEPHGTEA